MKHTFMLLVVSFALSAAETTVIFPYPVKTAEGRYNAAMEKADLDYAKAVTSAAKAYNSELEFAEQTATKSGNLDLALAIRKKREELIPLMEGTPTPPKKGRGKTIEVVVDAKSDTGASLGTLKVGQRITVQYVSGVWTPDRNYWPAASPDTTRFTNNDWEGAYPQIVGAGVSVRVPLGTSKTPFTFTVTVAGEYALRAYDNHAAARHDNSGEVRWKVTIE